MKVSVCVPTFERPETMRLLIESFLAQDHADRELSIADDSRSDAVERLVTEYDDHRIVYHRQKESLGFCGNLRWCLEQSSGEVAVILGDDDLLARTDALSIYAATFASNPTVGYACANLVQIDEDGEVTFAYEVADATTVFEKGPPALEHLLLSSVHIAGIAFRRVPDLLDHYPREEMLFPQVKLAAAMLTNHAGVAIGAFLTAARMHENQLGFAAMKRNKMERPAKGGGRRRNHGSVVGQQHGNVEVMEIIEALRERTVISPAIAQLLERRYTKSYATNMVNEKINCGNRRMLKHLQLLRQHSNEARNSVWLVVLCAGILVLPRRAALQLKLKIRGAVAKRVLGRYKAMYDWPLLGAMQAYQRESVE